MEGHLLLVTHGQRWCVVEFAEPHAEQRPRTDGIAIYHSAPPELPADLPARIAKGLEQARVDDYEGANDTFAAMTDECPAIALIDAIQQFVLGHGEELDAMAAYADAHGWGNVAACCRELLSA